MGVRFAWPNVPWSSLIWFWFSLKSWSEFMSGRSFTGARRDGGAPHTPCAGFLSFFCLPFLFSLFWCRHVLLRTPSQLAPNIQTHQRNTVRNKLVESKQRAPARDLLHFSSVRRILIFRFPGHWQRLHLDRQRIKSARALSFPCCVSVPFGQFCPWAAVPSQRRRAYKQSAKLYRSVCTVLFRTSSVLDLSTQLRSFPAIAQMPLGSANDFGNILGWGQLGSQLWGPFQQQFVLRLKDL